MAGHGTVCCICNSGYVGFQDPLIQCPRCSNRYQHRYCINDYSDFTKINKVCYICLSEEEKSSAPASHDNASASASATVCCICNCGDVGLGDPLIQCSKCLNRYQHKCCSSNFAELNKVCNWCQPKSRDKKRKHHPSEEGGSSVQKDTRKAPSSQTTSSKSQKFRSLKNM